MATALNEAARLELRDAGISQAEWARRSGYADGKWGGDKCGCPDDRCIGHHHDAQDDCGCLRALLTDALREVTLVIKPLGTPAKDLPFGMAYDVGQVLKAYGLDVLDESLQGRGLVEVQTALVRVIDAVPTALGGRRETEPEQARAAG